jgi:hypothetical protein
MNAVLFEKGEVVTDCLHDRQSVERIATRI